MTLLLINKIIIIIIIFHALISLLVHFPNRKSKLNQSLFLSTIFMTLWFCFGYLFTSCSEPSSALLWLKLNFSAVCLFFVPAYFFATHFPPKKTYPILNKLIPGIGVILAFITIFSDFFVQNIQFEAEKIKVGFGSGIGLLYGMITIAACLILGIFLKKYFQASKKEKIKIQYILIGTLIFGLGCIISAILFPFYSGNFQYIQTAGGILMIISSSLVAYAFVEKELFGIKIILTQLFIALIAVLLALDALVFTEQLLFQILKIIILIFFIGFGYLLYKSVVNEIKGKQELKQVNLKLKKLTLSLEEKVQERTKALEEEKASLEIRVGARTKELGELNEALEQRVAERTKELQERIEELNKWYRLTVGRELRMKELKEKIEEVEIKLKKYEDGK